MKSCIIAAFSFLALVVVAGCSSADRSRIELQNNTGKDAKFEVITEYGIDGSVVSTETHTVKAHSKKEVKASWRRNGPYTTDMIPRVNVPDQDWKQDAMWYTRGTQVSPITYLFAFRLEPIRRQ